MEAPYAPPSWACAPAAKSTLRLDVLKTGVIVESLQLAKLATANSTYLVIGRADTADVVSAHASISRFHAVLQFGTPPGSNTGAPVYLWDLGSTHGTFVNKKRVPARAYVPVLDGFHIRFGASTRSYVLCCEDDERGGISVNEMATRETPIELAPSPVAPKASRAMERKRATLEAKREKLDRVLGELENIRAKDDGEKGLSEGQQKRIQVLETKADELEAQVLVHEQDLSELEGQQIGGIGGSKQAEQGEHAYQGDGADDDVLDETAKSATGSNRTPVETEASLRTKVGELEASLATVRRNRDGVAHSASESRAGREEDALDQFMEQNKTGLYKAQLDKLSTEIAQMERELARLKRMQRAVANSGPLMPPPPPRAQLTCQISPTVLAKSTAATTPDMPPPAPRLLQVSAIGKRKRTSGALNEPAVPRAGSNKLQDVERARKKTATIDEDECYHWEPPTDQTGDGRSTLNDKLGY